MGNVLLPQNSTAVTHLSSTMTAIAKNIADIIVMTPQFIINGWSGFLLLKAYQVEYICIEERFIYISTNCFDPSISSRQTVWHYLLLHLFQRSFISHTSSNAYLSSAETTWLSVLKLIVYFNWLLRCNKQYFKILLPLLTF